MTEEDEHTDKGIPSREQFSVTAPSTVLIVEDDRAARLMLAAMLRPLARTIVFASQAAEVRGRIDLIQPDVIICDMVMDEMRGDEFIRWLRAHPRWAQVPVVAVTRLDSPLVRAHLLEAGADSVLVKPCNPRELRAQVQAVMRRALDGLDLSRELNDFI